MNINMCCCSVELSSGVFEVALGAGEDDVDPDAHEVAGGRDEVEVALSRLDDERGGVVGTLDGAHVVDVDLVDGGEGDRAAQLGLALVHVVEERALAAVEDEPPLVPHLELLAHLEQVAATRARVHVHARAGELMAAVLHVSAQVEVRVAHGQVASERSRLLLLLLLLACACAGGRRLVLVVAQLDVLESDAFAQLDLLGELALELLALPPLLVQQEELAFARHQLLLEQRAVLGLGERQRALQLGQALLCAALLLLCCRRLHEQVVLLLLLLLLLIVFQRRVHVVNKVSLVDCLLRPLLLLQLLLLLLVGLARSGHMLKRVRLVLPDEEARSGAANVDQMTTAAVATAGRRGGGDGLAARRRVAESSGIGGGECSRLC